MNSSRHRAMPAAAAGIADEAISHVPAHAAPRAKLTKFLMPSMPGAVVESRAASRSGEACTAMPGRLGSARGLPAAVQSFAALISLAAAQMAAADVSLKPATRRAS